MVNAAAPVVDAWKCPQNVRCPLELPSHFTWLRIQKRCCCAWKRSMVTCDKTRLWLANIASSIPGTAPPAAAVAALDAPSALWADQHADQPAAPPCCGTVLQYLPPACASSLSNWNMLIPESTILACTSGLPAATMPSVPTACTCILLDVYRRLLSLRLVSFVHKLRAC